MGKRHMQNCELGKMNFSVGLGVKAKLETRKRRCFMKDLQKMVIRAKDWELHLLMNRGNAASINRLRRLWSITRDREDGAKR